MTTARAGSPDVVVLGDGVIGLASALALAARGATVTLVGARVAGAASGAAAGILATSMHAPAGVPGLEALFVASRDLYPGWLATLAARSGHPPPALNRLGILDLEDAPSPGAGEVALDAAGVAALEPALEPALAPGDGAVLRPDDGAVDNLALLAALRAAVRRTPAIAPRRARAERIAWEGARPSVVLDDGARLPGAQVVVALGAWSARLDGLPRRVPVEPLLGQMLAFDAAPLRHVVFGRGIYLVPRGAWTVAGSTTEQTGFDVRTTEEGLRGIREASVALCPALAAAARVDAWAGLRPVTPDFLPLVGRDPEQPALLHASGHSRNGILLAPLTASAVAALAANEPPAHDLAPFSPARFLSSAPDPTH